jgi:hypothetical protein
MKKSFHPLFLVTSKPIIHDPLGSRDPQVENHWSEQQSKENFVIVGVKINNAVNRVIYRPPFICLHDILIFIGLD